MLAGWGDFVEGTTVGLPAELGGLAGETASAGARSVDASGDEQAAAMAVVARAVPSARRGIATPVRLSACRVMSSWSAEYRSPVQSASRRTDQQRAPGEQAQRPERQPWGVGHRHGLTGRLRNQPCRAGIDTVRRRGASGR